MLIGPPRAYGIWGVIVIGLPQHAGLAEHVLDNRLNARTFLVRRPLRFIYSNINYHLEHHMYPMVPCHALPRLHEAVKPDCPAPSPFLLAAWRKILLAHLHQQKDPSYFVTKTLPPGTGRAHPPQTAVRRVGETHQ